MMKERGAEDADDRKEGGQMTKERDKYVCENCGATSDKHGVCCGEPMTKKELRREGGVQ